MKFRDELKTTLEGHKDNGRKKAYKNCNQIKAYKNRIKLKKITNEIRRPKAPHNTTSFIIESHSHNDTSKGKIEDSKDDAKEQFCIEDFIIIGGSMKGIFLI